MPWVYMLRCSDESFYIGSTTDLEVRLDQHAMGKGARYTARRRPIQLAWALECDRRDEAWELEKKIQGWSRAKRIALAEGRLDDLPDLSRPPARPDREPS